MKACGSSPAGQRGQRSRRALERALAWSPPVEGTSVSGKPVALTCQRWKRDQAVCSGLLRQPSRRPSRERCQRVPIDGAAARLTRPQRSTPTRRESEPGWQSRDPKPAARRQARGCRRPDDREVVRRLLRRRGNAGPERIWKSNAGGLPHGARPTASEGKVSTGARDEKRRL
jgi:hypothetical protein